MWIVYHTKTLVIWKKFFLEQDAQKKRRRLLRANKNCRESIFEVEWMDDEMKYTQWKMWKTLQQGNK